jgi:hypothetical protein
MSPYLQRSCCCDINDMLSSTQPCDDLCHPGPLQPQQNRTSCNGPNCRHRHECPPTGMHQTLERRDAIYMATCGGVCLYTCKEICYLCMKTCTEISQSSHEVCKLPVVITSAALLAHLVLSQTCEHSSRLSCPPLKSARGI